VSDSSDILFGVTEFPHFFAKKIKRMARRRVNDLFAKRYEWTAGTPKK
jgi:hypothetical protein